MPNSIGDLKQPTQAIERLKPSAPLDFAVTNYTAGAPLFANFAKGGNQERMHDVVPAERTRVLAGIIELLGLNETNREYVKGKIKAVAQNQISETRMPLSSEFRIKLFVHIRSLKYE